MLGLLRRTPQPERRMDTAPKVHFMLPQPNRPAPVVEPAPQSVEEMVNNEVERDLKVRAFIREFVCTADPYLSTHPEARAYAIYERLAIRMLPMIERRFGPLK